MPQCCIVTNLSSCNRCSHFSGYASILNDFPCTVGVSGSQTFGLEPTEVLASCSWLILTQSQFCLWVFNVGSLCLAVTWAASANRGTAKWFWIDSQQSVIGEFNTARNVSFITPHKIYFDQTTHLSPSRSVTISLPLPLVRMAGGSLPFVPAETCPDQFDPIVFQTHQLRPDHREETSETQTKGPLEPLWLLRLDTQCCGNTLCSNAKFHCSYWFRPLYWCIYMTKVYYDWDKIHFLT